MLGYSIPILAVAAAAGIAARLLERRAAGARSAGTPAESPASGWPSRRLVSLNGALQTLAGWTLAGALVTGALTGFRFNIAAIVGSLGSVHTGAELAAATAMKLLWFSCAAWAAVGGLGFGLACRLWHVQHQMSRHEVQLEQREIEGDPAILAARRQQLRERATTPALQPEEATLIVVHRGHEAVLLHYDATSLGAPRLIGIARGPSLNWTMTEAQHHDVPLVEDPKLARALAKGTIGAAIDESLFEAVANLLSSAIQDRERSGRA